MAVIIDRRLNPSGKSTKNRQRFLERAKDQIKKTIKDSVADQDLRKIGKGKDDIKVRSRDLSEPSFRKDFDTGRKDFVRPGNDQFSTGDEVPINKRSRGKGNKAGKGDGLDDFEFTLTKEEFLKYLFDDLELPDFIKETLMTTERTKTQRAGFTNSGSPANLNVGRTFKKSIGRRLALARPTDEYINELEEKLQEVDLNSSEYVELLEYIDKLKKRQKTVPFIDENDLKYNLWTQQPNPESQAVMFCLMDVSGSMGEIEKDISKRFFLILYLFLESKYEKIDIRFVRHTEVASEVDEETFFYSKESGGTAISSGLECIDNIIQKEYNPKDWNIYIAQCTDGDNYETDNEICRTILTEKLLPIVQFFSYIEVGQMDRGDWYSGYSAWPLYSSLALDYRNVAAKKVRDKSKVWQVFTQLFKKDINNGRKR